MPVNLSIKSAPDEVVDLLRLRAKRNHRSLQGELLSILEDGRVLRPAHRLTPHEVLSASQALGDQHATSSSVEMIRKMRDERDGR